MWHPNETEFLLGDFSHLTLTLNPRSARVTGSARVGRPARARSRTRGAQVLRPTLGRPVTLDRRTLTQSVSVCVCVCVCACVCVWLRQQRRARDLSRTDRQQESDKDGGYANKDEQEITHNNKKVTMKMVAMPSKMNQRVVADKKVTKKTVVP